jgi:hypothetical protein
MTKSAHALDKYQEFSDWLFFVSDLKSPVLCPAWRQDTAGAPG